MFGAEFGLFGERLPRARYVPPEASYLAWVDCAELDSKTNRLKRAASAAS